jgi:hypothetical protein
LRLSLIRWIGGNGYISVSIYGSKFSGNDDEESFEQTTVENGKHKLRIKSLMVSYPSITI